jgi:hypothetical protein
MISDHHTSTKCQTNAKTNKNLGKQIRLLVSGEFLDEKMGYTNNRRFRQSLIHTMYPTLSFFWVGKTTRSVWAGTIYGPLSHPHKNPTFLLLGTGAEQNSSALATVSKTINGKDWRNVPPMDPAKRTTRRWTDLSLKTKNVTNVLKISSVRHPRFEAFSSFCRTIVLGLSPSTTFDTNRYSTSSISSHNRSIHELPKRGIEEMTPSSSSPDPSACAF